VRDREGFEQLRAAGVRLGEHPYDLYTLETAEDVNQLSSVLGRHRDSSDRPPCLVMNFCLVNLDFPKMRECGFKRIELLNLREGLPGHWLRHGLFDEYLEGIKDGVFYPAMHGLTHFCRLAVENALAQNGERARQLRSFWDAETPYIYWRMPWVGYEYCSPEKPAGFLPFRQQHIFIQQSAVEFKAFFGTGPVSACAPGYRADRATCRAWAEAGVRVVQNGSGMGLKAPHVDEFGLLHLYRVIDLEPAQKEVDTAKHMEIAAQCIARGLPVVISTHSINFHSTLKDFRSATLNALDELLTALEQKYPDLLYVNDADIYALVNGQKLLRHSARVSVSSVALDRRPREYQEVM
jgi:hypothetical protein